MNDIDTQERRYQTQNIDRDSLLKMLHKKGFRITEQRKQLIEIILSKNCSNCKEIYFESLKKGSKIGMATIYRMMNLLEEVGALKWRNEYYICDQETPRLENCMVELEDASQVELQADSIREVFEKGMEACGYLEGKKVRHIVVKS